MAAADDVVGQSKSAAEAAAATMVACFQTAPSIDNGDNDDDDVDGSRDDSWSRLSWFGRCCVVFETWCRCRRRVALSLHGWRLAYMSGSRDRIGTRIGVVATDVRVTILLENDKGY
jgi:hypothetical protein